MERKSNCARAFLQLIKPKVGSTKWLSNATKERILAYREEMWNKLMDPNEDMELRNSWREWGYSSWAQASLCGGFSCCRLQALGCAGFSSCGTWAQ